MIHVYDLATAVRTSSVRALRSVACTAQSCVRARPGRAPVSMAVSAFRVEVADDRVVEERRSGSAQL
ncbi:hypothetical protein QF026_000283 [Streptomyces aurantiacus]|uniref:hypothetical protein n=1 Tax=Streptomyces aurantiacus TaxID=47760 RepID=UPI00278F2100|nr:hypothetical protein [Streptomyces aurantiacus]MDQ0771817.1 hypothetical protein [Streptomyces aurantiacus]